MITQKIKALFQFIEFLHSNIDNFNQHKEAINELQSLGEERRKANPERNFAEKLKYEKVQANIDSKLKIIEENIIHPIQAKANKLKVCDPKKPQTFENWNGTEIRKLKENFSKEDLPEIFSHKNKYIEYRTKTGSEGFFIDFFFDQLDGILKRLFDYFKETERNEFEAFETKTVYVNNDSELIEQLQKRKSKTSFTRAFFEQKRTPEKQSDPPPRAENNITKLNINQIALKHVYDRAQITRENGNEIAKQYGHLSGEKLFQRFTYYSSAANRRGKPNLCTPKKLSNKIELFKSVIKLLPTNSQGQAKDDVSILEKIYENEYQ